ncbi:spore coat protein YsxE [Bacillus timonensis]|nr:spore coat protein YsxE [Bacillus timonensis]
MSLININKYGPVLNKYRIKADYGEHFGKVTKIYTPNGIYGLKEVKSIEFLKVVHLMLQKGYKKLIPILPNIDGQYATQHNSKYYYLTSWIENKPLEERNDQQKLMVKELTSLHAKTSQTIKLTEKDIDIFYKNLIAKWEKKEASLSQFLEKCEEKLYMSPFELQFCTYFHEIFQASQFARKKLENWYELVKEKNTFRVAINHGNIQNHHFLIDQRGNGFFSSFEKATIASPINDVVKYFQKALKTYPTLNEDLISWYYMYESYYPLQEDEQSLFLSYLTFPEGVYRLVVSYQEIKHEEQRYVKRLLKNYWQLKNIEYVALRIEEIEKHKKQQEESHTTS